MLCCLQPVSIPPCGIVPSHRQTYLLAPFCFLYSSAAEHFFVYRALYARYLHRLTVISSRPSTLLTLAAQFESLLQWKAPRLCFRMHALRVPPLQLATRWLHTAFAGWLPMDQLLLLWDRLWASESLALLAVLAAALLVRRASSIMAASSEAEVRSVMRDLQDVKVVALLQSFIFDTEQQQHQQGQL